MNAKKRAKALLALALSAVLCLPLGLFSFAGTKDFEITDPYAAVNWETVNAYKTALHTHTNASDGDPTLKESVQRHAETGFDLVATTDHGTVNCTWETPCPNRFIHSFLSALGRNEGDLVYLGKKGTFDNGVAYTYATADNGDDYLTLEDGRTILRIPYGIENNAVSVNAHVNSWFADYCDNSVTTYEDAVKGVDRAGGVCVINHPGEYTKARYELRTADGKEASLNQLWNRRQSTKYNGTSYIQQRGAEAIYTPEGKQQVRETIQYYMENARIMREGLTKAGLQVFGGENAPYIWFRAPQGMTSWQFFDRLLEEVHVVCTPGVGFGPSGEGYIRLTAFGSRENSLEAMQRILTWLGLPRKTIYLQTGSLP